MEQDVNNEHFLHDIESISVTHLSPDSPVNYISRSSQPNPYEKGRLLTYSVTHFVHLVF